MIKNISNPQEIETAIKLMLIKYAIYSSKDYLFMQDMLE